MAGVVTPRFAALACAVLLAAGCASTPQAPAWRDAEAKEFRSHPGASSLYVYRPELGDLESDDSTLYVDGRLIGATLPQTYFLVHLRPGEHVLTGIAFDNGSLRIETRPGELYFVELDVDGGQSYFTRVEPEEARREIRACCTLLERWRPGQRPLLR